MLSPLDPTLPPDSGEPRSVAVVVPSYDHANYIERTLRSIFAQTLKPQCLLVIDDGSTDGSPEIIERVLKDAPFPAELIARENRGLPATLNEAKQRLETRNSKPETRFFAYLGSDDIWLPTFLQQRITLLESRPNAALAYGNAYSIDADERVIDCSVDWATYTDADVREMLLRGLAPMSPTVVYRTAAIADAKWNENSRLEDYEFYLRLSTKAEFAYDPAILSAWRQHGSNASEGSLMMMEEKIAALHRTAHLFGLTDSELDKYVSLARFRGAQELMRRGHKSLAAKHGLSHISSAASTNEALRFAGGLLTPKAILDRRRERARKSAIQKFGSL